MTKLEKLVALFGSQQRLATAIGMTRGRVSQWLQPWKHHRDTLPPHLNDRVRLYAQENLPKDDWPAIKECLEDACPTCGRVYDDNPHDHFTPTKTFQKVPYAGKE